MDTPHTSQRLSCDHLFPAAINDKGAVKPLLLLAALVWLAISPVAKAQTDPLVPPHTALTAVIIHDAPPTSYRDPKNQQALGFAVETMDEIAKRAGLAISQRIYTKWYGTPKAWMAISKKTVGLSLLILLVFGGMIFWRYRSITTINQRLENEVSERRQTAKSLQESNERFSLFMWHLPGVAFIKDRENRHLFANQNFEKLFQLSPAGWRGKTNADLLPPNEAAALTLADQEVINNNAPLQREDHILGRYWISYKFPIQSAEETLVGGIAIDISERKMAEEALCKSEQRFRNLFENVLVVSLLIDPADGAIVDANAAAARFYGWTVQELRTMKITEVNTLSPEEVQQEMALARSEQRLHFLFQHRLADNTTRDVEVYSGPIQSGDKTLLYSIIHDITEQKRAEEALIEKTRLLEELSRDLRNRVEKEVDNRLRSEQILIQQSKLAAMGEMLGAISHQWRQPLNALGLIVQNVQDAYNFGELDKDLIDSTVEKSMRQIQHMSKTINDFRNFFRPDKEKTDFDPMRAIGDVLVLLSAQLSANGISYRFTSRNKGHVIEDESTIISSQERMVRGYRNEFEHVILNLIHNARDAIMAREENAPSHPFSPGLITFDLQQTDSYIAIDVTDNGGGIAPGIIDRIFEPYFTTKEQAKGTGLGLYISKVIMGHMDGTLSAKNSDHGAVFTLTLPVAPARGE